MLGAQARAAELQAAKAAAMRQKAHHEIDELAMPPEPVPVSLTDFVRNPLLNKNKGIKNFRPLIDSDFDAPRYQTDHKVSGPGTPSGGSAQLSLLETAPVAPRAMLTHSDPRSSRMTPSRVRAPTFTPQAKSANLSAKPMDGYSGLIPTSPYTDTKQSVTGHVFGPEDLSPAKQEIKFNEIRELYESVSAAPAPVQHFPTPFMMDARMYASQHSFPYDTHLRHGDTNVQTSYDPHIFSRPVMQQYQSEADTSAIGYNSVQSHAERTHLFAEDLMEHQIRLQQHSRSCEPPKTRTSIVEIDEPYDRYSKMQSFVAAQQAMARKGKTVLHNPDLHRSPHPFDASALQTSMSPTNSVSRGHFDASTSSSTADKTGKTTDSGEPAGARGKGFVSQITVEQDVFEADVPSHLTIFHRDNPGDFRVTEVFEDNRLLPIPTETMREDWCTLRPMTERERQVFWYNTRKRAVPSSRDTHDRFHGNSTSFVGDTAREWLIQGGAFQSARRAAITEIVDKYEKDKHQSSVYGIIGKPLLKEKSDLNLRGGLKAVANIMATLYDCSDEFRKHPEFSQYTMAPEYAIDQRVGSDLSLFDDLGFEVQKKATDIEYLS